MISQVIDFLKLFCQMTEYYKLLNAFQNAKNKYLHPPPLTVFGKHVARKQGNRICVPLTGN